MALDVRVVIERKKAVAGEGFGVPLVFAGFCAAEVPYTECASVDEVAALFGQGSAVAVAAGRMFGQALPPPAVAVYGGVGSALSSLPGVWDRNWRQLVIATDEDAGEDSIAAIAAHVDAAGGKIYFARASALEEVSGEGRDITLYRRVYCMYHPGADVCPEAAVAGFAAGRPAGEITYKNLMASGVAPCDLTDAQVAEAAERGCYCVVVKAGDVVTTGGKTGVGEYLDVVDAEDYVVREIERRTQKALNAAPKVPYDNNGIALLESVCVDVLADAFANGIIAVDGDGLPDYAVDYKPRSETRAADRAARRYVEGSFTFALAGAVHEAVVHGVIEI